MIRECVRNIFVLTFSVTNAISGVVMSIPSPRSAKATAISSKFSTILQRRYVENISKSSSIIRCYRLTLNHLMPVFQDPIEELS